MGRTAEYTRQKAQLTKKRCLSCWSWVMRILVAFRAIIVRGVFIILAFISVGCVVIIKGDKYYWLLLLTNLPLALETAFAVNSIVKKKAAKGFINKWFSPVVFLYLLCACPPVWLIHIHLHEQSLNRTANVPQPPPKVDAVMPVTASPIPIQDILQAAREFNRSISISIDETLQFKDTIVSLHSSFSKIREDSLNFFSLEFPKAIRNTLAQFISDYHRVFEALRYTFSKFFNSGDNFVDLLLGCNQECVSLNSVMNDLTKRCVKLILFLNVTIEQELNFSTFTTNWKKDLVIMSSSELFPDNSTAILQNISDYLATAENSTQILINELQTLTFKEMAEQRMYTRSLYQEPKFTYNTALHIERRIYGSVTEIPDYYESHQLNTTYSAEEQFKHLISKYSPEDLVRVMEQLLLLSLIIGRWLLPRGGITRDQLSQLLLVNIGMAADILELFEAFKENVVKRNSALVVIILFLWQSSLVQFTLVKTATRARKIRMGFSDNEGHVDHKPGRSCLFCETELWAITCSLMLQDFPFFLMRMTLIFAFGVVSYSNVFFTAKNSLVILLQLYRSVVLVSEHYKKLAEEQAAENEETEDGARTHNTNSPIPMNATENSHHLLLQKLEEGNESLSGIFRGGMWVGDVVQGQEIEHPVELTPKITRLPARSTSSFLNYLDSQTAERTLAIQRSQSVEMSPADPDKPECNNSAAQSPPKDTPKLRHSATLDRVGKPSRRQHRLSSHTMHSMAPHQQSTFQSKAGQFHPASQHYHNNPLHDISSEGSAFASHNSIITQYSHVDLNNTTRL